MKMNKMRVKYYNGDYSDKFSGIRKLQNGNAFTHISHKHVLFVGLFYDLACGMLTIQR